MLALHQIYKHLSQNLEEMGFEHEILQEPELQLLAFQLPTSPFACFLHIIHPDEGIPNVYLLNVMHQSDEVKVSEELMDFIFFLNNHLPSGSFSLQANHINLKLSITLAQATQTWDSAFACACLAYFQGVLEIYMPIAQELGKGNIDLAQAKQKSKLEG